jgi:signal transduction histidine kinase/HAMP domain-containing protein
MPVSIKSKIALGIGVLFALLLTMCAVAIVCINLLSAKTENLLTANYNTIRYCSEMSAAIDEVHSNPAAMDKFEQNLIAQEHNITEPGEAEATRQLRSYFEQVKTGKEDSALLHNINRSIYDIYMLNRLALERKNESALHTAADAKLWLTLLATVVILISFTLALNFPGYIANPVKMLTEGIKEIAQKNYEKRIYLSNKDEFGEMADAFNQMAKKLYEYDHSNLSKLMFEKKRVETIINQMEDAVIGFDATNRVLFMNHNAELLLNLKENDVIGRDADEVATGNDLLRTILRKDVASQPLKIIVENKENYFVAGHRPVFSEGMNIGEVITLRNITAFKELDISKTNLLATISHELKTPISSIKMSSKLIKDDRIGKLNTEQNELMGNIEEDADRLLRITAELLNLTQVETGNIQLKLQKVAASDIIDPAIRAVQLQADQRNIKIGLQIEPALPPVNADAEKTSWVLVNLLTNAIKYTPDSGNIVVAASLQDSKVIFAVQDHGPGIEEKYLSRIFDRYFKVPDSMDKTGTGLGLAISKEFINAQGGEISVDSEFGTGSTFRFTLPV